MMKVMTYEVAMEELRAMFPHLDPDVLHMALVANNGHFENTIDSLLAGSGTTPDQGQGGCGGDSRARGGCCGSKATGQDAKGKQGQQKSAPGCCGGQATAAGPVPGATRGATSAHPGLEGSGFDFDDISSSSSSSLSSSFYQEDLLGLDTPDMRVLRDEEFALSLQHELFLEELLHDEEFLSALDDRERAVLERHNKRLQRQREKQDRAKDKTSGERKKAGAGGSGGDKAAKQGPGERFKEKITKLRAGTRERLHTLLEKFAGQRRAEDGSEYTSLLNQDIPDNDSTDKGSKRD